MAHPGFERASTSHFQAGLRIPDKEPPPRLRKVRENAVRNDWIESASAQEVSRFTSRLWFPSGWDSTLKHSDFHVRIATVQGSEVVLSRCEMAPGCRVTFLDDRRAFYALWMGLEGLMELGYGERADLIASRSMVFRQVQRGLTLSTREAARGVLVFFPSELLHRRLQESRDRRYSVPVRFHEDVSGQATRLMAAKLLSDCLLSLGGADLRLKQAEDFRRTENILVALLLETIPHGPARVQAEGGTETPWYITLAENHMREGIAEPVSMKRLAQVTGMNPRTLHEGFRKHRGYSPMKFLREQRMARVMEELSQPVEKTTVTEVALKWGFCHLSRFSSYYSARFGERPSDTLSRARASRQESHRPMHFARASVR
jgi:AraC-like DNA-binding protein